MGEQESFKNDIELLVPDEDSGERIDRFLTISLEQDFSRSYVQRLIKQGCVRVNGSDIKQNYRVRCDDIINLSIPEPVPLELEPRDIPVDILYEDSYIAVINKSPGLVVHPGPGNWDNTLVNALLFHLSGLSGIGGVERPGIVHRLDKDTAGLMVIARNDQAHNSLVSQFAERKVFKQYKAIVTGKPSQVEALIDRPIGRHPVYRHKMAVVERGREARTSYKIERIWNTPEGIFTLLNLVLHTGRTHQIRVHLSSMGNPIVGDPIYSKKWKKHQVKYLLLCAFELSFTHPETGEKMNFTVPLPEHFLSFINKLDQRSKSLN